MGDHDVEILAAWPQYPANCWIWTAGQGLVQSTDQPLCCSPSANPIGINATKGSLAGLQTIMRRLMWQVSSKRRILVVGRTEGLIHLHLEVTKAVSNIRRSATAVRQALRMP